ncbi:hypothetical protein D3C84_831930 [compost metagenome]
MGNKQRRLVLGHAKEVLEYCRFGHRVHRSGRFIQHHDIRIAEVSPADGDLLPLPLRQLAAPFEHRPKQRVSALRQSLDKFIRP